MDFSQVKKWYIPVNGVDKEVKSVSINGVEVWKNGPEPYITIKSDTPFSVSMSSGNNDGVIYYSTDKTNWTLWVNGTGAASSINSTSNGLLYVKQEGGTRWRRKFSFSGASNVKLSGHLGTLLDASNPTTVVPGTYAFEQFAYNNTVITDVSELVFLDTTSEFCYAEMFRGCTSLVYGPKELPATYIKYSAYYYLFNGCTELLVPPKMPQVTIEKSGCYGTFYNCKKIENAPEGLDIHALATSSFGYQSGACYYMFYGCTLLKTVPKITVAEIPYGESSCFASMYQGCTSLTQINKFVYTAPTYSSSQSGVMSGCFTTRAYDFFTSPQSGYTKAYRVPFTGNVGLPGNLGLMYIDGGWSNGAYNTTYYIKDSIEIV